MTNEELAAAVQAGDREKLLPLWEQVERFVAMQAGRRFRALGGFGGATEEDLYQSGFLALVAAVDSFNPAAGMSFIGWLALALKTAFAEAAGYRRRDPLNNALGLNAPVPGTDDLAVADTVEDPEAAHGFEEAEREIWLGQLREALKAALETLPEIQADTLRRRFYLGQTLAEIGAQRMEAPETVRQQEAKALRALRRPGIMRPLREFAPSCYAGTGLAAFRRRGSQPEHLVILREEWNNEK